MSLTEEQQDKLIEEYRNGSKPKFRKTITKIIRDNPTQYKILELSQNSDATHVKEKQFNEALPKLKKDLIEIIFHDIDEIDDEQGDGQLKMTTIIRWVNNKKRMREVVILKDENFVYDKLKKFQFNELDADEGGTIDREEMHAHFKDEGVDPAIIDVVFDVIDANGDGDISVREWFQWQQKFKKSDLKKLFKPINVCISNIISSNS